MRFQGIFSQLGPVLVVIIISCWCLFSFSARPSSKEKVFPKKKSPKLQPRGIITTEPLDLLSFKAKVEKNWKYSSCAVQTPGAALNKISSFGGRQNVFVQTPCLDEDSIGNLIGNYVEGRLCADALGISYVAINKLAPYMSYMANHSFFKAFPDVVYNSKNATVTSWVDIVQTCSCRNNCHKSRRALLHSKSGGIDIFKTAIDAYWLDRMKGPSTALLSFSSLPKNSGSLVYSGGSVESVEPTFQNYSLPIIPDVAIHYRCSDNFIGHYGFLPFPTITDIIVDKYAASKLSIYVLAENRKRKILNQHHSSQDLCDDILNGLVNFIAAKFPTAEVVLLRGHNIFEDLARLAFAKLTICSVSTFCFWPAIASTTNAYFPATALIHEGNTTVGYSKSFHWITSPYLKGQPILTDQARLVERLSQRLTE
jgi:hypothetical protein